MDDRKRKREDGVEDAEMLAPNAKKAKTDMVEPDPVKKTTTDPSVQSKLEALKRSIAEKKAKLQEQMDTEERKKRDEAAKKLEEIKTRQLAEATARPLAATTTSSAPRMPHIKLEPGANGKSAMDLDLESIPKLQSSLKANQRYIQQQQEKKVAQPAKKPIKREFNASRPAKLTGTGAMFDPRMAPDAIVRKKRALTFVEPGTYIKQAEELRAAQEFAFAQSAAKSAKSADTKMEVEDLKKKKVRNGRHPVACSLANYSLIQREEYPLVEWWDAPYLTNGDYAGDILEKLVTANIDHPILIEPPADKGDPGPRPLILTPKERKRLRKQNRADQQKLMQDKILLGEIEPPKPRIRIANMMRVLGAQAVQDPTQIEKKVREEMAEREDRHNQRNQERYRTLCVHLSFVGLTKEFVCD